MTISVTRESSQATAPKPTETPEATPTPKPTNTPAPTNTPVPTATTVPPPLTGGFLKIPPFHDSHSQFTMELALSEPAVLSGYTVREHSLEVTNGRATAATPLEEEPTTRWLISVKPDQEATVTVRIPYEEDCSIQGAVCTADGHPLGQPVETAIPYRQLGTAHAATETPAPTTHMDAGNPLTASVPERAEYHDDQHLFISGSPSARSRRKSLATPPSGSTQSPSPEAVWRRPNAG